MKKLIKKKNSESIGLTYQPRLTHQTWDPCHESMITKYKFFNINELNQTKK
jgi:hypothetical protein